MLEFAGEELQGDHVRAFYLFVDGVYRGLWSVFLAPDSCYHRACVPIECNCRHCVSSGGLDRRDIKSKGITSLMCTPDMEICVTLQARYASTVIVAFAEFASLIVSQSACADSFNHVKTVGVAELDFCVPESAIHMDPIVICSSLERFARNERTAFLLLSNAVLLFGNVNKLFLHTLLLAVPVTFLFVCDFGLFVEVLFCDFVRT